MIFEGTKKSIFFGLGLTRAGKPIKDGALDIVTRELAESGKSPAQATLDTKI